ncbi:MAG: DsrE family protein [Chloroflexi bacterium]|nr:DsrE family protein [Chloroflexota bacterium]MCL5076314.1 DsrE family protein [Chloroflexota bacterium]
MAKSFCVLLRRSPYGTIHAAEAVRHINGGVTYGLKTTAILIDDGVYAAKAGQHSEETGWLSLSEALAQTLKLSTTLPDGTENRARIYAHGPSLMARGLRSADLVPGVQVIDAEETGHLLAQVEAVLIY